MLYCKNCGAEMNDNQDICIKCGVKKGVGTAFCANCGQTMQEGSEVCLSCGVAVKKSAAAGDLGGKDKVTMALLCFFLGGFGVHNFVMGESKKGIFKIIMTCCCGIGGILALVDFIKILMDKYVVDPDKLI